MFIKKKIIAVILAVVINGESLADMPFGKYSKNYRQLGYHSGSYSFPESSRQKDDYYRYSSAGDISPYTTRPIYSNRIQSVDGNNVYGHSSTGPGGWSATNNWNGTYGGYQIGYFRGNYQHDLEGSQSISQYQFLRSPQTGYYKKPSYYVKGKIAKAPEKPRQKKLQVMYYNSPFGYKKSMYPRVHAPYMMHKYPIKKTVHPYYRRYYQAVPSMDMLRNKVKNVYSKSYYGEESSTAVPPKETTDRPYDSRDRQKFPSVSDEYFNYNGTYHTRTNGYSTSYDGYGLDHTTGPNYESSTRGYYGERIYMTTQIPSQGSEKGVKHRLYIHRKEAVEDGNGTIYD